MTTDAVEQTLFVCREVSVFRIPPRVGAGGYRSGDWKVADKIFTGRVRVIAKGEVCEVRLEEPGSGNEFAVCPFGRQQRNVAVEQASDSSRNFVIRLEDRATKRHAFVGLSFTERGEAFDFNVALSDFDKHLERAEAVKTVTTSPSSIPAAAAPRGNLNGPDVLQEASLLYKKQDLSLKDGQTIKVNMKRQEGETSTAAPSSGGGFLSRLAQPGTTGGGFGLAPPPSGAAVGLAPPPGAVAPVAQPPLGVLHPPPSASAPQQQDTRQGWATFE